MLQGLGDLNVSLILAALGSAMGIGAAGMAAVGAWKKAFSLNKAAPFIMVAFVGAPLSQTFYGFLVRDAILKAPWPAGAGWSPVLIGPWRHRRTPRVATRWAGEGASRRGKRRASRRRTTRG